jgi:queuine tRNA-ribosyltransferase
MGLGDPAGLLELIARGIDLFDCVLPTRWGRTGSALVPGGRLNLRNARYARDERPLAFDCACPACRRFSRAYLRHLVTQGEIGGLRLLTIHNLHTLLDLLARTREAIVAGRFDAFRAEALAAAAGTAPDLV